ncbi:putative histidine phosphotransferase HPT1p [Dactylonectria macrodidyma]|uniref:Histidine phosphotransferase HPT1p n=1 Tax=Dactylonectria macrodidyma TaxID=307937 RepID=A0A9P9JIY3_9HYPO|nr:putative histidine phosphotransferase HPT1p [Dactylonectria macrodidyma]
MSPAEDKTVDEPVDLNSFDGIDMTTFSQILEMDDPGDHEFSYSIVFDFFTQVEETFKSMDKHLEEKDLYQLYSLGHFLKGSSATLGLVKVRDGCEKIQRYGKKENLDGTPEEDEELCLKRIDEALKAVKTDYNEVEDVLRKYYNEKE